MYLVDNRLIDIIISRTAPAFIRKYASLSPSMKVIEIEEVVPTLTQLSTKKLQEFVDHVNGEAPNPDNALIEYYTYNYEGTPTILMDDEDVINIFYPYKKEINA